MKQTDMWWSLSFRHQTEQTEGHLLYWGDWVCDGSHLPTSLFQMPRLQNRTTTATEIHLYQSGLSLRCYWLTILTFVLFSICKCVIVIVWVPQGLSGLCWTCSCFGQSLRAVTLGSQGPIKSPLDLLPLGTSPRPILQPHGPALCLGSPRDLPDLPGSPRLEASKCFEVHDPWEKATDLTQS